LPEDDDQSPSTRPFWSGTITFGLVSIPVSLFPANRHNRLSLRMLSPKGRPLARRYYAPETGKTLDDEDMVRGYEIEKGKYIVVTDDELERLAPEKTRDIDLRRFVDATAIPPLYFENAYFLVPASGSMKAYRLLAATMEETQRAGIATFVMRGKEYLVAILSENGILRAETLRFSDEIRSPKEIGLPAIGKPPAAKVKTFEKAIAKLSKDDIARSEMNDESIPRIRKLAEQKRAKKKDLGAKKKDVVRVAVDSEGRGAEVIDILAVLQKSLQAGAKPAAAKR
jgi:DNA end-binding protein Ku